jgi:transcription antitermination factor NusG
MSAAGIRIVDTPFAMPIAQPRWYASYTCSRREKQVARTFGERGVECFLPLYQKLHQWAHDRREVNLPLFPGYVFVRISQNERLRVLQVPGVVRMVSFNGELAELPESEIEKLRRGLERGGLAEPFPYMKPGQQVEILRGPFQGLKGEVVRNKNNRLQLIVTVDLLMRSVALQIDTADLAPLAASLRHYPLAA